MSRLPKLLTVENGQYGYIRDDEGNEVSFETLEDMSRVTGMDFTGKFLINYEPEGPYFHDSEDPSVGVDDIPYDPYENLINQTLALQEKKDDPYYGVPEDQIPALAREWNFRTALVNRDEARRILADHRDREENDLPTDIDTDGERALQDYIAAMQVIVDNPPEDPDLVIPPPPVTQGQP